MAFRADEEAARGRNTAHRYLVSRWLDRSAISESRECVDRLIDRLGPVVESYPTWHPLVANHDPREVVTNPGSKCGYLGVDHTILFRNGFVTCPYPDGDVGVLESVSKLPSDGIASIHAERLDVALYHPDAVPIVVYCDWGRPMLADGKVPASIAVPMILEREVPCWRWSSYGETWESMCPYLIGQPCGSRSSLFVSQETGTTIRKIWQAIVETGAFGPLKMPVH